jgi:hypothetical protein
VERHPIRKSRKGSPRSSIALYRRRFIGYRFYPFPAPVRALFAENDSGIPREGLLLPGTLLMAIGTELLAALMLINLCLPTFL